MSTPKIQETTNDSNKIIRKYMGSATVRFNVKMTIISPV